MELKLKNSIFNKIVSKIKLDLNHVKSNKYKCKRQTKTLRIHILLTKSALIASTSELVVDESIHVL